MGNSNSKQHKPAVRYPHDDGALTYESFPLETSDSSGKKGLLKMARNRNQKAVDGSPAAAGANEGEVNDEDDDYISPVDLLALLYEIISMENIHGLVKEIEWVGFDPLTFLTNLWNTKGKKDEQGFVQHVKVLITLGVTRGFGGGKTIENICARTSEAGAKKIDAAASYFNVVQSTKSRFGVTIGRILTVFPREVFAVWQTVAVDKIGGHKSLPIEYKYPGSPAMMNEEAWKAYGEEYSSWMLDVSQNLWGNKDDTIENTKKWAQLSHFNNCSPSEHRKGTFPIKADPPEQPKV